MHQKTRHTITKVYIVGFSYRPYYSSLSSC